MRSYAYNSLKAVKNNNKKKDEYFAIHPIFVIYADLI